MPLKNDEITGYIENSEEENGFFSRGRDVIMQMRRAEYGIALLAPLGVVSFPNFLL